jgi:ubiquinone/menaquinone biosynthesis C-methylase UbiE
MGAWCDWCIDYKQKVDLVVISRVETGLRPVSTINHYKFNKHMPHIFDPQHLQRLDNPERRKLVPPYETLIELGLKPGQVLVDIGAGAGYFSIPAASITGPSGQVIATDMSKEMLDHLAVKAEETGTALEVLLTPPDSLPLPDHTADMTFMAFVFHELDKRQNYLAELRRITKPDGTLVIIDWADIDSPMGPPVEHRISLNEAMNNIASAGFKIETNGMLNPWQYFVTARPS